MQITEAAALARTLMNQYGLYYWDFGFDRAKRRMGYCRHGRRRISLSAAAVRINPIEEVRDTILHEIAHAIVGPGHHHDRVWQLKAIELGARPQRCASSKAVRVPGAYRGECMDCKAEVSRHRRPKPGPYYHTMCRYRLHSGRINWKF